MSTASECTSRSSVTEYWMSPRKSRPVCEPMIRKSRPINASTSTYNLGIPPILLDPGLPRETDAARPLDRRATHLLGNLTCNQLRDGGLAREGLSLFLPSCSVVSEQSCCLDLACRSCLLEGETLERPDSLSELLALKGVRHCLLEGPLCETEHLRGDTDAACRK